MKVIIIPDHDPETECCLICTGKKKAQVGLVVHCIGCKRLHLHSRSSYNKEEYGEDYHHYCRKCNAMQVREALRDHASEVHAERLNAQGLERTEIASSPEEHWHDRFVEWLENQGLPLEWAS